MTSAPVRAPLADHHRSPEDRPDIAARMRRIHEYCYPLEDTRARQAYGVPGGVNTVLSASGQRTSCQLGESPGSGDDPPPPGLHAACQRTMRRASRGGQPRRTSRAT